MSFLVSELVVRRLLGAGWDGGGDASEEVAVVALFFLLPLPVELVVDWLVVARVEGLLAGESLIVELISFTQRSEAKQRPCGIYCACVVLIRALSWTILPLTIICTWRLPGKDACLH